MGRVFAIMLMLLGLTALAAGCGGGGGSSPKSAADWASGYCSAATSWVLALEDARASVQGAGATATPSDAVQQVTDATNTFTQTVEGLGGPDTPDGSTSEATAKSLSNTLQGRVARAQAAIDSNNPDVTDAMRATTVRDQVTASLAAVSSTTAKLAQDDAALGTAMSASSECADLKTALSKASG